MGLGYRERKFHHRDTEHTEFGVFYEKFYSALSAPRR
jgi:hypothetical protein